MCRFFVFCQSVLTVAFLYVQGHASDVFLLRECVVLFRMMLWGQVYSEPIVGIFSRVFLGLLGLCLLPDWCV